MTKEYIDKNALLMFFALVDCAMTASELEIIEAMPTLDSTPEEYGWKIMELEKVLVKHMIRNTKYDTTAKARRRVCKAINKVMDDE